MRRRLSGLWMVIERPSCGEESRLARMVPPEFLILFTLQTLCFLRYLLFKFSSLASVQIIFAACC
jgi:hypothetical protein